MTDAEKIAEFLARKGATKCPPGAGALNHMTPREWRNAARSAARVSNGGPFPHDSSEYLWEMGFQKEAVDRARAPRRG